MSDKTPTPAAPVIIEAAFSANFKLFDPDGVQTQFTVRAQTPAEHLAALAAYRADLAASGYAASEPSTGTEDGEKAEEVAAYVRGTTKAGQALVWLYSSKSVLKWRLTTVYEERLGELPCAVAGQVWPGAAAPEREEAQKKGYLSEVAPFKVVLAENGQTDEGKPKYKFARVYGAPAPAATNGNGHAPAATNGNGNGHAPAATNGNGNGHAPAAAAPTNGNGHTQAAAPAPATNGNGHAPAAGEPTCPKCGNRMWDNRDSKRNPAAPDFKCRDKACDGTIWPPKNGNGAAKTAAPAVGAPAKTEIPF